MKDDDTKLLPLRNETLSQLAEGIERPLYDRKAITPGIVHIGLGNFHRAHQAWYVHRLMQEGRALDWGIIGASVRNEDSPQRTRLLKQDCLTTLIELGPSGTSAEVVGSLIGYLSIEDGNAPLVRQMSDPAIRIVSLTVTEGGYFLDPATKEFDPHHADLAHDAANLGTPRTAFGAIVSALRERRAAGIRPFTCQSCDNLPGNGAILRAVVVGLAQMADRDLGAWIDANVSFPSSMVDCIVPATGPSELALVRELGIEDDAPVTHENFRQWVIEDDFCAGRPLWEDVGATLSEDVHSHEVMKLRLLNGGHQIIAAPAELLGLETIADAMVHPQIRGLLRKVCLTEIAPFVSSVPDMTPARYVDLIDQRFSNPAIQDTVRRVAFDGSSRHTGAVIPAIRTAIDHDGPLDGLALSQALWAFMCRGRRLDNSVIEPNDPAWDQLKRAAVQATAAPQAWLSQRQWYGDIGDNARFGAAFASAFGLLNANGLEATLGAYLEC